jgi:hypothetical protein
VKVFSGINSSLLESFLAFNSAFTGGVRVGGIADLDGDGKDDIIVGAGPGGGPHAQVFDSATQAILDSFFAYDPHFSGGIFVGGH